MSGGHFNYIQVPLREAANDIAQTVTDNDRDDTNKYGDRIGSHYSPAVIEKFKVAAQTARLAAAMIQRVDWLICGDNGEDSFLRRWDEELAKLSDGELHDKA